MIDPLQAKFDLAERSYFCLTLDNGLHCVTTAWLELGRCAPIGQEFELVVLNDLEFQLTLQTKIEEPKAPQAAPASPTKVAKAQKPSTFSRVFTSPKKRRELELKQQEEERAAAKARQAELEATRKQGPTAWDLQHKLVGKDGSFARSYIALKEHENKAFGRPCLVDIPCFNEWTMEESRTLGSAKSGRSVPVMQKKAPYRIGKLELQLLYVPKPQEATDDDMPKSMNACVRELQEAERSAQQSWEGFLSQQGGDCPVREARTNTQPYSLTYLLVLAPSLLPPRGPQADRLPRGHAPAPGNDQPSQGQQADRRQVVPYAKGGFDQGRLAAQVGLRGRGRRVHVRRGRVPGTLRQRRGH